MMLKRVEARGGRDLRIRAARRGEHVREMGEVVRKKRVVRVGD